MLPNKNRKYKFSMSPSKLQACGSICNNDERHELLRFNIAPGWRRMICKDVIVYVSPSKTLLHNLDQVKDYLLSAETCKCGLPCPFFPETFFQFDPQIPNSSMIAKAYHTKSFSGLESMVTESKKRREVSNKIARLDGPSLFSGNGRMNQSNRISPQQTENSTLLSMPPWRKQIPALKATTVMAVHTESQNLESDVIDNNSNSNVTDIAVSGKSKPSGLTAGFSTKLSYPDPLSVTAGDASAAKQSETSLQNTAENKKPTFRDDPTGYLNQQTAILHSSISTLHSPERHSPQSSSTAEQTTFNKNSDMNYAEQVDIDSVRCQKIMNNTISIVRPRLLKVKVDTKIRHGLEATIERRDNIKVAKSSLIASNLRKKQMYFAKSQCEYLRLNEQKASGISVAYGQTTLSTSSDSG